MSRFVLDSPNVFPIHGRLASSSMKPDRTQTKVRWTSLNDGVCVVQLQYVNDSGLTATLSNVQNLLISSRRPAENMTYPVNRVCAGRESLHLLEAAHLTDARPINKCHDLSHTAISIQTAHRIITDISCVIPHHVHRLHHSEHNRC